jgi:hypothetical protein
MLILTIHALFTLTNLILFYWAFREFLAKRGGTMIFTFLLVNKCCSGFFNKLDTFYNLAIVFIRQWMMGNVDKLSPAVYRITHVIEGEIVTFHITRTKPCVIDVQDDETDESCFASAEQFVKWTIIPWQPARKSTAYYDDGTAKTIEPNFIF